MNKDKFLIIDGSSLFFRAFYALPLLKTKRGIYTNAVYGFVSMLENAIEMIDPEYVMICFDQKGKTFRHELYDEYKGTREKTPSELDQQWPILMEILNLMNIKTMDSPDYEADDLAGTLAKMGKEENLDVYLLTGDRDYLQLIEDDIQVLMTRKGISEMEIFDEKKVEEEYELRPDQLIDLKGFMGDSSDNIPGVPGIGEKTGIMLLKSFETMDGVYENIDKVTGKKRVENLKNYQAQAYLSKKLGTIVTNIPLDKDISDFKRQPYQMDELRQTLKEYEFFTLLNRLPGEEAQEEDKVELPYELMSMEEAINYVKDEKNLLIHIVSEGKVYEEIEYYYLLIAADEKKPAIVKIDQLEELEALRSIIEDPSIEKIGVDLKEDFLNYLALGFDIQGFKHDTSIAEYIIDPTKSNYSLSHLVNLYFNEFTKNLDDYRGKGRQRKAINEVPEEEIYLYLASMAHYVPRLRDEQMKKIVADEMEMLYDDIEMPLIEVLASMEYEGVNVDASVLQNLEVELKETLDALEQNIYDIAGEEFNINSPKQLSEILFDKLELPPSKKTKTGYSTSVDVLEKLRHESPIIPFLLEYRQISKLYSTYIIGLQKLINPRDEKIHSIFRQTVTATGRLSSTDPNLQNIPIRTDIGRLIRKAFVAGEGYKVIDADYSQIELRILAHVSKDETMLEAFRNKEDIHRTTASEVFNIPKDEVSSLLRSRAKAVNFGIVYGISDYGLSQDLDISRKEAKEYIDSYLDRFSGVHQFMKDIVEFGKEHGYVETLFHRRRYIPELSAKNYSVRSFGERVALNMPIQGTAADIIKKSMVDLYQKLKEQGLQSKLLLQVHDELILQAPEEEVEEVSQLLKETMEDIVDLSVPLVVDLEVGKSWYDTK